MGHAGVVPAPLSVTPYVQRFANPVMVNLAGHGWFVELEHIGRRTGTAHRTPLMAFRQADTITVALTYGPDVQWLKNLRAAGGGRMHWHTSMLTLGPPVDLTTEDGLARMPQPVRAVLSVGLAKDFVELPVLHERPFR